MSTRALNLNRLECGENCVGLVEIALLWTCCPHAFYCAKVEEQSNAHTQHAAYLRGGHLQYIMKSRLQKMAGPWAEIHFLYCC
jgi:hypothetical protein